MSVDTLTNRRANAAPEVRLLDMTRAMLACAEAADWDQLISIERSRLALFKDIFEKGVADRVELAKQVLAIDKKTQLLAEGRLPELRNELSALNNSGKANQAYQSIQKLNVGDT